MVHKENFVVAIKNNGSILREVFSNTVYLPFGSEYSILLKNLNSVSAVVDVDIDGSSVGKGIIVRPNSSTELEGFLEGLSVKNRFKFIQKTKEISDYRGDHIDDGIVRVEYRFEKLFQPVYRSSTIWYNYTAPPTYYWDNIYTNCCANDDGITVKGSDIDQKFNVGYTNDLEEVSHVISMTLKGITENSVEVKKPITTKSKQKCDTCGRISSYGSKFCYNCGTRLV